MMRTNCYGRWASLACVPSSFTIRRGAQSAFADSCGIQVSGPASGCLRVREEELQA